MTQAGIECFLAICRHKTGIAAARSLYITQSSLSIRLKTLEKELGGALFYRKNGSREMLLTDAGKRFYKLAVEYEALMEKMGSVCVEETPALRVASLNSLGVYLLPEVYEAFLQKYPEIRLEIQDKELAAAAEGIICGETDLAFTSGKVTDERLRQIPVFSEETVLIAGAGLKLTFVSEPAELSEFKEIYIEWSRQFGQWHENTFGLEPRLTISIMSQLRRFMEAGDVWAIVPKSVAAGLGDECDIRIVPTAFSLPRREISAVMSAEKPSSACQKFLECMKVGKIKG